MSFWDDGKHKIVKRIQIKHGYYQVYSIKIDYESDGKLFTPPERGQSGRDQQIQQIDLETGEYLTGMFVYYGANGPDVNWLKIQSNKRTFGPYGEQSGTYFSHEAPTGTKILGFFGCSCGRFLGSIGAHFGPITPVPGADKSVKLEAHGGKKGGIIWDDGVYDTVRKIYVGQGDSGVQYIKFEYDVGGQPVQKEHGKKSFIEPEEFELQYPDEYLVRVEGYYEKVYGHEDAIVISVKFVTSKDRVSQLFGMDSGNHFVLENGTNKIIGFHGRVGEMLCSLGAYTLTTTTPVAPPATPAAKKLEAKGSHVGRPWDDGDFDDVRVIFVRPGTSYGVGNIYFEYEKNGEKVISEGHGSATQPPKTFVLNTPSEYLVSVEGTHANYVVQYLRFTSSTGRTETFGTPAGRWFSFREQGSKIVGFHGYFSSVIHALGVYLKPITK